jgi:Branched-chain amino acid ABC-type transport system, permease components
MVSTGLENAILNGIVTGSFIALGAIGLSLVYNIAGVPNFAHGELLMIGAYLGLVANAPASVPVLGRLAGDGNPVTVGVMAVLFALTAASAVGTVVLVGGLAALRGDWWPVGPPSPAAAVAVHVLAVTGLGLFVALAAPSIWAGFVLAGLVLAFVGPLLDRYIFSKFREDGAALATILMATMGLAFVLRFTMQAFFGGSVRSYQIQQSLSVSGYSLEFSAAKFVDLFLTGEGVVLRVIDTAPEVNETLFLGRYAWPVFAGLVVTSLAVTYGSYRLRGAGVGENEAAQTIGPRIVGAVTGVLAFVVLLVVLPVPGSVPDPAASIYASRIRTSIIRVTVVVLALVLMTALHVVLRETKLGKAMRAASDNLDLAKVTGIDTGRVMMVTWVIAGGYAAVAGIIIGILFFQIVPSMGFFRLLPIFAAVILGGLASVYGAMVGAFAVGLAMEVGFFSLNLVFPLSGTHRVSLAFVLLLAVLLVRPEGIVGGG